MAVRKEFLLLNDAKTSVLSLELQNAVHRVKRGIQLEVQVLNPFE